jgi:hypothetical protein
LSCHAVIVVIVVVVLVLVVVVASVPAAAAAEFMCLVTVSSFLTKLELSNPDLNQDD